MINRLLAAKKSVCWGNQNMFSDFQGTDIKAERTFPKGLYKYFIYGNTFQEQTPTTENPSHPIGVSSFDTVIASKNLLSQEEMYSKAYERFPNVVVRTEKDGRECIYFKTGVNTPANPFTINFKENIRYTIKTTLYYETDLTSGYGVIFRVEYTDGTSKNIYSMPFKYKTWMSYTFTTPIDKSVKKISYTYNINMPTYMDINNCAIYEGVYTSQTVPEFTKGEIPYIVNTDISKASLSSISDLQGIKLEADSTLTPTYIDSEGNKYIADYIAKNNRKINLINNIGVMTYTKELLEASPPQFDNLSQYNNSESCVCYLKTDNKCIENSASTVLSNYFSYIPSFFEIEQTQTGISLNNKAQEDKIFIRLRYDLGIVLSTDTDLQKSQKLQQWLIEKAQQENPLVVMYALAAPQVFDITDTQLGDEFAQINSFDNYSNIYNTQGLWQYASIKLKEN